MTVLICIDCAKKFGCRRPESHISSVQRASCNFCEKKKEVSSTWDWIWPYETETDKNDFEENRRNEK